MCIRDSTEDVLRKLPRGSMAIAHCRYGTTGCQSRENAQPLVIRHIKGGMALAHNGNLTNAAELRESFELDGAIFRTTSDSEVIAYASTRERSGAGAIEEAVSRAMGKVKGAYSLAVMSPRKLIAVRDPIGFRPLCIGAVSYTHLAAHPCAVDTPALNTLHAP